MVVLDCLNFDLKKQKPILNNIIDEMRLRIKVSVYKF